MQRAAPGMRSASAQPNWSIARIAIRCAVCGRRPKRWSCSRTAVRERRAAGHDEQRVARAQLRDLGAQRPQRAVAGLAREPAADLDDGQHAARRRVAASSASAAAGAASSSAALQGSSSTGRPRRSATARARNAPTPRATTGGAHAERVPTCRAAASIWRTCSAWR